MRSSPVRRTSPWPVILGGTAVALLALASIAYVDVAFEGLGPVRRLATRPVDRLPSAGFAAGPRVFRGTLTSDATHLTPLGVRAAAWAGWVTATHGSGKNQHTWIFCRTGSLDGLSLRGDGSTARLAIDPRAMNVRWREDTIAPRAGAVVADFGTREHSAVIPPAAFDGCGTPVTEDRLDYYEVRVADGAAAEVSACGQSDGETLAPCGDGLDVIAADGVSGVARAWANEALTPLRWWLAMLAFVAVWWAFGAGRRQLRIARGG